MTLKKWLEASVWVLIYGGMILVGVGLSARQYDTRVSWVLVGLGLACMVAGLVLIGVRARLPR